MEYRIVAQDELYHYGRKGMKWGQNIFGKEARTKRKRVRTLKKARVEKAKQKKISEQRRKDFEAGKIKLKDMTIDELREYKLKSELQRDIANLRSETASKTTKAGKQFVSDFAKNAIGQAVIEGSKQLIKDKLIDLGKNALGLNKEDELASLKKQEERTRLKNSIEKNEQEMANRAKRREEAARKEQGRSSGKKQSGDEKSAGRSSQKQNNSATREAVSSMLGDIGSAYKKSGASVNDVVDAFREPVSIVRNAVSSASSNSRSSANYNNTWYRNNESSSVTKNSWSAGRSYVSGLLGDGAVTGEIHTSGSRSNSGQTLLPSSRDVTNTSQYRLGTQYIAGLLEAPKDEDK